MSRAGLRVGWVGAVLGTALFCAPTFASPAVSNSVPSRALQLPLPPVNVTNSPVDTFRELLAMNSMERKAFLANRSPENRKQILAKVREYESLDADRREWRLQATQLRWYLWPVLNGPVTNRATLLVRIPAEERKAVEARLEQWDKLSPEVQKELLENEATIRYFTELQASTEEQRKRILEGLSAARRQKLEAGVAQWQRLPEEQRRKNLSRFNQFFDLTPEEKKSALKRLSEPERRQIEKTLRTFEKLSPAQRSTCIASFEKFASLSLEERQQFLKNAEKWKLMKPEQRQAWRELVAKLYFQPLLPPGFATGDALSRTPPLPPPISRPVPLATNGN